jgi:hypothetical protein
MRLRRDGRQRRLPTAAALGAPQGQAAGLPFGAGTGNIGARPGNFEDSHSLDYFRVIVSILTACYRICHESPATSLCMNWISARPPKARRRSNDAARVVGEQVDRALRLGHQHQHVRGDRAMRLKLGSAPSGVGLQGSGEARSDSHGPQKRASQCQVDQRARQLASTGRKVRCR